MPKRVIDFDAMWGSDKLAACAAWAQAEYAWLYGLADASGCFELTNLRVIWGRVAAIRANLTIERLEQVFAEFQDKGLLFVWEHEGKRYAHWTGSDVPGRLPPPSWRMRLEKFAPPVPKQRLAEYMGKFARGRAALGGVGFSAQATQEGANAGRDCKFEVSNLERERESGRCATGTQGHGREQEVQGADFGADCRFDHLNLREPGRGAGRTQDLQMTDARLLVADCGEDCRFEISNLKEALQPGERSGDSYLRKGQALAEVGARDEMARETPSGAAGSGLKERLEGAQAQDLGLDRNLEGNWEAVRDGRRGGRGDAQVRDGGASREEELSRNDFCNSNSNPNPNQNSNSKPNSNSNQNSLVGSNSNAPAHTNAHSDSNASLYSSANAQAMSAKELAVLRELRVGQGPVCGPCGVKAEVLERDRRRQAARAGSRSP
jgi:hypothetical protein